MSYTTLGQEGVALVDERKWEQAIAKLDGALKHVQSPVWLAARSKAHIGLNQYIPALADANAAWHAAYGRSNRKLMIEAQHRRAIAYSRLGMLANAACAFEWVIRLCDGKPAKEKGPEISCSGHVDEHGYYVYTTDQAMEEAKAKLELESSKAGPRSIPTSTPEKTAWDMAASMRISTLRRIGELPARDPARKLTATQAPDPKEAEMLREKMEAEKKNDRKDEVGRDAQDAKGGETVAEGPKKAVAERPKQESTIRTQDFQTDAAIIITLFTKGVDRETLAVEFSDKKVSLSSINYPDGGALPFTMTPWDSINPAQCKYQVTPNKVELTLRKATPGKWPRPHAEGTIVGFNPGADVPPAPASAATANRSASVHAGGPDNPPRLAADSPATGTELPSSSVSTARAPAYPTSAKSGPKDWDKLGSDEEDDEASQDANFWFKKLYKGASEDGRRAMMKSFIESNGTALSTDWDEVKIKTVDTVPPEGVEAKKWDA